MERRKFFRNVAIGGSLLLTAPVVFNSCSNDSTDDGKDNIPPGGITVDLTDPAYVALKTVGGYAYSGNIIIIRSTEAVYLALSKVCTHQGCDVTYNSTNKNIPCPCHGSIFSTTGSVLHDPAINPLKTYDVKLNGNILTIS